MKLILITVSPRDGAVGGSTGRGAGFPNFFGDMDDHLEINNCYDISDI